MINKTQPIATVSASGNSTCPTQR